MTCIHRNNKVHKVTYKNNHITSEPLPFTCKTCLMYS